MNLEKLALDGGTPVRTKPLPSVDEKIGIEEETAVVEVVRSKQLRQGPKLREYERAFAEAFDMPFALGVSSGTAACHAAIVAAGVEAGDEVIFPAVSDMGSALGALYENAVPIFVDVDPQTINLDPAKVEEALTPRTKCIMPVHLFGHPADMNPIMEIAGRHGLTVIEDCAQAHGSEYHGRICGSIGDMACFSLMSFKHMAVGEGGMVLFRKEEHYQAARRFAIDRGGIETTRRGVGYREHVTLGLNYRMPDLTAAVGVTQLRKLPWIIENRIRAAESLSQQIADVPGVQPACVAPWAKHTYWFYPFNIYTQRLGVTVYEFARALSAEGISTLVRDYYLMYDHPVFLEPNAHKRGEGCPWVSTDHGANARYYKGMCPQAEKALLRTLAFAWNEFFDEEVVDDIAQGIRKVVSYYAAQQ